MNLRRAAFFVLALGSVAISKGAGGASADAWVGKAPLRVNFSCSQANVAVYQWQFNYDGTNFIPDSSNETSGDISYVYTEPGTYFARVQWFDATTGAVDGQTLGPIRVYSPPLPPVVTSSHGPIPVSIIVGTEMHPVTFNASATASAGQSIVSYTWDFQGDGKIDASTPGGLTTTATTSYTVAGYYTYTVTAVDDGGLSGTDRQTVRVGAPPTLAVSTDPPTDAKMLVADGLSLFRVQLTPSVVSTIVSAQIDFGDGTSSGLAPDALGASHVYAAVGTYTVTVQATDDMGYSSSASTVVKVNVPPHLVLQDFPVDDLGNIVSPVMFHAEARTAAAASITSYVWTFTHPDGSVTSTSTSGGTSSELLFTVPASGVYQLEVQVHDSAGRSSPIVLKPFRYGLFPGPVVFVPPPPKVFFASVDEVNAPVLPVPLRVDPGEETGSGASTTDSSKPLAFSVRVGHPLKFVVSALAGAYPLANFGWDLDGDHLLDVIDGGIGVPGDKSSTQIFQYETPGIYLVECAVGDQNPDHSSAVLARMRFLIAVLPVRPGDTAIQGWITQPKNGKRIWGNHVTVKAKTSPASQTGQVEFQFRAVGATPWTTIGVFVPPPHVSISVPWDVRALAPGAYELRALTSDKAGNAPYSSEGIQVVTVTVDSANPDQEEHTDVAGLPSIRNENVDPNAGTHAEVAGNTAVEIPAHGVRLPPGISVYPRMRLVFEDQDRHPLETKFQKLRFIPGCFRTLSLDNGALLAAPSRIALYNTREAVAAYLASQGLNPQNAAHPNLTIYQFDTTSNRWVPLFSQVQQPEADLVRASTVSMGDIALGIEVQSRRKSSSSESACGLLGLEALAILLLARAVQKKHLSFS